MIFREKSGDHYNVGYYRVPNRPYVTRHMLDLEVRLASIPSASITVRLFRHDVHLAVWK